VARHGPVGRPPDPQVAVRELENPAQETEHLGGITAGIGLQPGVFQRGPKIPVSRQMQRRESRKRKPEHSRTARTRTPRQSVEADGESAVQHLCVREAGGLAQPRAMPPHRGPPRHNHVCRYQFRPKETSTPSAVNPTSAGCFRFGRREGRQRRYDSTEANTGALASAAADKTRETMRTESRTLPVRFPSRSVGQKVLPCRPSPT
jgi:hypothetical protein